MIKLIASDLDGTLLNKQSMISQKNTDKIKQCIENGVHFAFCTGRAFAEMDNIFEQIPFIEYAIMANGAYCFNTKTKEIIYKRTIKKADIRKIYDVLKEKDVLFEMYTNNKIYCNKKTDEEIIEYIPVEFLKLIIFSRVLVDDMDKLIDDMDENDGAVKLHIFFSSVSERDRVYEEVKNMDYDIISQSFNEIEFNAKGVNKGTGIQLLAERLGIQKDEIMAFGDNFNDISMRDGAGTLIVVDNAVAPLKKIADFVTTAHDEDGVAYGIEKFIG